MSKTRLPQILAASAAAISLTASASEPSQAEIEKAVRLTLTESGVDKRVMPVIHEVKKLACSPAGSKVFTCDVMIDATEPMLNMRSKQTSALRLVRMDEGWRVSQ